MAQPRGGGETVAALLVRRLRELGATHVFGVPGDYTFGLCDAVEADNGATWVGAANELVAGYAADGFARERGIAALCVTYGVGELSAMARRGADGAPRARAPCRR